MTFPTKFARAFVPAAVVAIATAAPAADSADMSKLKAHISAVHTMTANFLQIDSRGRSVTGKMVLERLDAELGETDDQGRMLTTGKVAAVAVVGNEDGAHHVSAEVYQALSDVGFTIPANGVTYWVGEAMQSTDYQDLDPEPEKTAATTATLASNAAHLAALLKAAPYPPA